MIGEGLDGDFGAVPDGEGVGSGLSAPVGTMAGGQDAPPQAQQTVAAAEPAKPEPVKDGISPRYHAAIGQIESSGGASYGNGGGIYQFIPSTAATLGYTQEQIRAMPPEQQTALNDRFTKQNTALLSKAGVPVNDVSAYVAHQQGPGGAAKLYHADPNANAVDVVGQKNADGNKPFFYNKDGTPKTVQQALDTFGAKVTAAGGAAASGTRTASASGGPAPAAEKKEPSVRERIAAWMQGRNVADTSLSTDGQKPTKQEPEKPKDKEAPEQEAAVQPYAHKPTTPLSGVVRAGGKVYFQRYGRTFDASGNLVG